MMLRELGINDLGNMVALQAKVIANLHPAQQHFIIHRDKITFKQELEKASTVVFGVYNGESLVAVSMVAMPNDNDEKRDYPHIAHNLPNSKLAIYKSTFVDPDCRGLGIMSKLINARNEVIKENNREVILTSVSVGNEQSLKNIKSAGFEVAYIGFNSRDKETNFLVKKLNPALTVKVDKGGKSNSGWSPVSKLKDTKTAAIEAMKNVNAIKNFMNWGRGAVL